MRTIEDGWIEYYRVVIPKNAGQVQKEETKRAFYAGAMQACYAVSKIGGKQVSLDSGANMFQALVDECVVFFDNLKKDDKGVKDGKTIP